MRNKAIFELYPNVLTIGDNVGALDKNSNQVSIDESLVQAKIAELEAAEPMRLLRLERNRRLAAVDWWVLPDRTPTQAQLDYRQALRNLPATAEPQLDDNDNLTNVTWPKAPE